MDGVIVYQLGKHGKIIINETDVYYGFVQEVNEELAIAKLIVIDWRDRFNQEQNFKQIVVPTKQFLIKYEEMDR